MIIVGWLHSVVASTSALHAEGLGFTPRVRCEHVGGDAPPSEIHFLEGNGNILRLGVEVGEEN